MGSASWRPMTASDLPQVSRIAERAHPAMLYESPAAFESRYRIGGPLLCFVLASSDETSGYAVARPWDHSVPKLDTVLDPRPHPTTLFLHDSAILPECRGRGFAEAIVERLKDEAVRSRPGCVSLVAVNGTAGFWGRRGFAAREDPIDGYGSDAVLMRWAP